MFLEQNSYRKFLIKTLRLTVGKHMRAKNEKEKVGNLHKRTQRCKSHLQTRNCLQGRPQYLSIYYYLKSTRNFHRPLKKKSPTENKKREKKNYCRKKGKKVSSVKKKVRLLLKKGKISLAVKNKVRLLKKWEKNFSCRLP